MTGTLNIQYPNSDYPVINLLPKEGTKGGMLRFDGGTDKRRLYFSQYPSNSAAYPETYLFPVNTLAEDATEVQYYNIVTNKHPYLAFPVGSCYTTATNTNPSTILKGGTWSLIDKQFTPVRLSGTDVITYNSSTIESYDVAYAIRSGHTITIDLGWNFTSTSIDDSTIAVGTLNIAKLGFSAVPTGSVHLLFSGDGPNGICLCAMTNAGALNLQDTVVADGADTMTVDGTVGGIFTLSFTPDYMLDSACNQFIWKRTA